MNTILQEMDIAIDNAITKQHYPNVILLGKLQWDMFTAALNSIGVEIQPGRTVKHRGLIVYEVALPVLMQVGTFLAPIVHCQ